MRRRFLHSAGPADARTWVAALCGAGAIAAVADITASRGVWRPEVLPAAWAWAATLAVAMGLVQGVGVAVLFAIVRRMPRGSKWAVWPPMGVGVGAWLARELGAFSRLAGKDALLAVVAVVASLVGAVGLGVVVALYQPDVGMPRGGIAASRRRRAVPFALVVAAVCCGWIDRNVLVGKYSVAHHALQVASLWLFAGAIVAVGVRVGPRPLRRARAVRSLVVVLCALAPFLTLREAHQLEIRALLSRPYPRLMLRWARALTDVDRDGFSAVLGGGDCDDLSSAVSPIANEIANNGVDDNCLSGDARAVDAHVDATRVEVPTTPSPMSVVLITIDTVRADRLSVYGHTRDTTPGLARLAKRSAVFDRAFTPGGWTSIAVSSLMRGVYPRNLFWTRLVETSRFRLVRFGTPLPPGETFRLGFALPLDDPLPPLPVRLQRRGMYTAAVVDDGFSEFLSSTHVGAGFDRYVEINPTGSPATKDDRATADATIELLRTLPPDKPFFLWVHFFGPHEPSTQHPGVPFFGPIEADRYDHEIRFADQQVQRVIASVDRAAARSPVALFVASDHGEIIRNDHDRDHGGDLRPEALRIPLIVRAPGVRAGRYATPVSLVDVMPTILALTETPAPAGLDGVDLRRAIARDPDLEARLLFADTWRFGARGALSVDQTAVIDGVRVLVRDRISNCLSLTAASSAGAEDALNLLGIVPSSTLREALTRYQEEAGGALPLSSDASVSPAIRRPGRAAQARP